MGLMLDTLLMSNIINRIKFKDVILNQFISHLKVFIIYSILESNYDMTLDLLPYV